MPGAEAWIRWTKTYRIKWEIDIPGNGVNRGMYWDDLFVEGINELMSGKHC